jgi:SAM-dependent methyltransferase
MSCKICQSDTPIVYTFEEKMFGFKGAFEYLECASCGCLQIEETPKDLGKYYPPYYYSYNEEIPILKRLPFFKRLFSRTRMKRKYKGDRVLFRYLKEINTDVNDKILDVGCGNGLLIAQLFNQGFKNVEGVDTFLPKEINYDFGVKVHKKEVAQLPPNTYDLVMMHHVLEHVPEQIKTLQDIHSILKDKGCLMIRIPVINEAWEIYGENWVQLDAPRHLYLHTVKSLNILAEKAGFEVKKTFFDSSAFQFLASEIYKQGIPLCSKEDDYKSYSYDRLFSAEQIEEYERKAEELNKNGRGDSAVFYLYKV